MNDPSKYQELHGPWLELAILLPLAGTLHVAGMTLAEITDAVSQRTDFWFGDTTTEATYVSPSADRTKIAIVAGDISSGPVFMYTSATDA